MRGAVAVLLVVAAAGAQARAADERSIAFLGTSAGAGWEGRNLATLDEAFLSSLGTGAYFTRVIGHSDLQALLGFERTRQLAGCSDSGCLAELAGALGVTYVSTGEIGRLGDVTLLHLKVLEVRSAEVAARAMRRVERDTQLVDAVTGLVSECTRLLRGRDIRLGRVRAPPPLALAFVPLGVGQYANRSPVKGTLLLAGQAGAFATFGWALSRFEAQKLPGSGGLFQGGRFEDPAAAATMQKTYLTAFWVGVGLVAVGIADALIFRE